MRQPNPPPKMTQTPMPLPMPTFKYLPLQKSTETRILTLHRGSLEDPIRCTLTHFDLTYEYEALSYEWGPRSEERKPILLNDTLVRVRQNLYHALLHLRRSTCDRHLWVDALCINQKDRWEKNRQLRMMGTIYARSVDTLVWLGLAQDDSDLAISHLNTIGLNNRGPKQSLLGDERKLYRREVRAILALCNRPYWRRIWVIQEIRLAHQVTYCCGDKTIPGETFSLAGKYIQEATNPIMAGLFQQIGDSLASRIVDYTNLEDLTLKKWMIKTPDSLASDQKDKVYALVNLAKDCRGSSELIVDCGKKVPFSQIYKDVMRVCSVDKQKEKPVHDVLDLSYVLQRTLNNTQDTVQLDDSDTDKVWICGIFSAQITSFETGRGTARVHALRPKNIFTRDATSAIYTKSNNCILAPGAGRLMRIIRKRRISDPDAPVEVVDGISIASMPCASQLKHTTTESSNMWQKLRLADDSSQESRQFRCSDQNCSGLAPSDAMLGDWVCRFPCSRIGLVFRQVNGQADAWMLVGRAIMDERFQISEKETEEFWKGKPQESSMSVAFGCDNAWYLKLDMVTLQRLTAPEVGVHTGRWEVGMRLLHSLELRYNVVRHWNERYLAAQWLLKNLMGYGKRRYGMDSFSATATRYLVMKSGVVDWIGVSGYVRRLVDPD